MRARQRGGLCSLPNQPCCGLVSVCTQAADGSDQFWNHTPFHTQQASLATNIMGNIVLVLHKIQFCSTSSNHPPSWIITALLLRLLAKRLRCWKMGKKKNWCCITSLLCSLVVVWKNHYEHKCSIPRLHDGLLFVFYSVTLPKMVLSNAQTIFWHQWFVVKSWGSCKKLQCEKQPHQTKENIYINKKYIVLWSGKQTINDLFAEMIHTYFVIELHVKKWLCSPLWSTSAHYFTTVRSLLALQIDF